MAKYKYPQEAKNRKDFWKIQLTLEQAQMFLSENQNTWPAVKLLLKHPNCPKKIRQEYENHDLWYKRLVAFLVAPVRNNNIALAIRDKDYRVRRAGYKTFIREHGFYMFCKRFLDDFVNDTNPNKMHLLAPDEKEELEAYIEITKAEIKTKADLVNLLISPNRLVRNFAKEKFGQIK